MVDSEHTCCHIWREERHLLHVYSWCFAVVARSRFSGMHGSDDADPKCLRAHEREHTRLNS